MRKLALAALIAFVSVYPLLAPNRFFVHLGIMTLLYVLLGTSWNLLGGYAGQISFGHAAFFGTGAYTSTILLLKLGISPWPGMFAGGLLAALLSIPIGWLTLRLRGPYFALATLAASEVMRIMVFNWDHLTGGGDGLNILVVLGGLLQFYYIALALACGAVAAVWGLTRSRWGLLLSAIREDEEAAEALGVAATRMKLIALVVSAFFVALGGSFFASYHLYINPDLVFESSISIQMIIVSIVGGLGTIEGPILGAVIMIPLSEYFRGLSPVANLLIYGIFIVLFMTLMPEGLIRGTSRIFQPRQADGKEKLNAASTG